MSYVVVVTVMFVTALISVFLDCKISRSNKNIVSKLVMYALLNNIILTACSSLTLYSGYTPNTMFCSLSGATVAVGCFTIIASVFLPIIIRKRLPKVLQNVIDRILSYRIVFCVVSVLTFVLASLPKVIKSNTLSVLTNFALFGRLLLALLVPVVVTSIIKYLKEIKSTNSKTFTAKLRKRFAEADFVAFKKRFIKAVLVNAVFAFSVILFIPYETYLTNVSDFVFKFSALWWIIVIEAFIYVMIMTLAMLTLGEKLFDIAVSLCFGATIASYVQGMFLNGSMTVLNGIGDTYSLTSIIVNIVIWLLIMVAPAILTIFKVKFKDTVIGFGCVLIVGMQAVALVSTLATVEQPKIETRISESGLFEVSGEENTIVFVLDRFDLENIDAMLEEDPTALDGMRGFTCYDNVTGSYCYTHLVVPYLISGERIPQYNPTPEQYINAMESSDYLDSIVENVSNVGIYTDETHIKSGVVREKIDNIKADDNSKLDAGAVMVASQKSSMYRVLPFCFKKYFSYTSSDFNKAVIASSEGDAYYICSPQHDALLYQKLTTNGLAINDDYTEGCFRFIHTNGAHEPWQLNRNCEFGAVAESSVEPALGSIKLVSEYLKQLNELGVYEESTIIVVADHGNTRTYRYKDENAEISVNPIMFFKPKGVGYDEPCVRSNAPVSQDDIFPTIMNSLGIEYETETGMNLNDVTESTERTRYFYWCRREPGMEENLANFMHVKYAITGDSKFDENWSETDDIVHCNGWTGEK